jgi:predicted MPP superfamily phosphohydrolase
MGVELHLVLFLLTFFILYGSLHGYVFLKVKGAFHPAAATQAVLIFLMAFLVLTPVLVRVSERFGYEGSACFLSYVGYLWMGILLLFFFVSLLLDAYRMLIYLAGRYTHGNLSFLMPSPLLIFLIPMLVSLSLNAYGYHDAKNIRTEQVTIGTAKIPRGTDRIRIVQISDVHVGMIVRRDRLEKIVDTVRQAGPDILVSTGDLVDGQIDNLMPSARLFEDIRPKYGKYAVTGNHEFYAGIDQAMAFHRSAGFRVLRGEALMAAGLINIAGVDDPAGERFGVDQNPTEKKLLSQLPRERFTLLLKHKPVPDRETFGLYDLQLSGHTHRGQIFPFSLLTGLVFPYHAGYFELPEHARLYVSRGSGTWGPPVRFLASPEVTIIDLIYQEEKK